MRHFYEFSNRVLCFFLRQNLDAWLSRWPARIFARSLARTNCDPPSRCPFLLMEPNWHNVHWSKSRPERWWCRRKRDRIHSHILSKLISKKKILSKPKNSETHKIQFEFSSQKIFLRLLSFEIVKKYFDVNQLTELIDVKKIIWIHLLSRQPFWRQNKS